MTSINEATYQEAIDNALRLGWLEPDEGQAEKHYARARAIREEGMARGYSLRLPAFPEQVLTHDEMKQLGTR